MSSTQKPSTLLSILQSKCPRCRIGEMYTQKGIFPLKSMTAMPDHCSVCGQKMELETGFYFGTGYVSYALSVGMFIALFILYHLLFGITYKNNSIFICLFSSIGILILLQPWMMRISRVLYLYMFVKYDADAENENTTNSDII